MKRTNVTYGQLDRVLRSLGLSCRLVASDPPARVYDHPDVDALIVIPPYPMKNKVYAHHMVMTQATLDNFGIATPTVFAAELQKAG